jgi:hypothetical protein
VIPGTGGFRKLRWTDPRRRKGKRGGLRVIYFHFAEDRLGEALGLPQVVAQVSKATQGYRLCRRSIQEVARIPASAHRRGRRQL